jgi:hypothetical protein
MCICIVIKTAFQKYKEKVQNSWTRRKPAKAKANSVNSYASVDLDSLTAIHMHQLSPTQKASVFPKTKKKVIVVS